MVGADCVIHAGCVLRERTQLGDRVVLQPGVVLGGDGFGYVITETGELEAMPQLGRVVVGDDVEIGANTTVDRGTLGDTRIERGREARQPGAGGTQRRDRGVGGAGGPGGTRGQQRGSGAAP